MIPRWMPYSTPIYIEPLMNVFERLRAKTDIQDVNDSTQGVHQDSDFLSQICEKLKQEE